METDLSGDTGMAYVTRTYRRRRGVGPGPLARPGAWAASFDGYLAIVFPHERDHFSTVIVRPTSDVGLSALRHVDAFDAACRAIPGLADWTDPRLATPTSGVVLGLRLFNVYRPQLGRPGLVALGDSVATTAPTAGRGLAMASQQISGLLDLLDTGADPVTVSAPFGAWCDRQIRPWVQDHLANDAEAVRRWQGADIDLSRRLTSAAIVAAADHDPGIAPHLGGYVAMTALPSSLAHAEPLARRVYETGWRPPSSEGPTRQELVDIARAALTPGTSREAPAPPVGLEPTTRCLEGSRSIQLSYGGKRSPKLLVGTVCTHYRECWTGRVTTTGRKRRGRPRRCPRGACRWREGRGAHDAVAGVCRPQGRARGGRAGGWEGEDGAVLRPDEHHALPAGGPGDGGLDRECAAGARRPGHAAANRLAGLPVASAKVIRPVVAVAQLG